MEGAEAFPTALSARGCPCFASHLAQPPSLQVPISISCLHISLPAKERGCSQLSCLLSSSLPLLGLPLVSLPSCPCFVQGSLPPALPGVGGGREPRHLSCLKMCLLFPRHGVWQRLLRGLTSKSCLDPGFGCSGTVRARVLTPAFAVVPYREGLWSPRSTSAFLNK